MGEGAEQPQRQLVTAGVLSRRIRGLRRYRYLYLMAVLVPMYGLIIAFKDYNVFKGILGSPWAGLYNFELAFGDGYFWKVVRNTAIISLLKLAFGFPAPIIIARCSTKCSTWASSA